MLTSYSRVLSRPGTLRFSATGLVARLPISMVGLGIVLLVSARTGSYAVAGAVSAAYMVLNAGLAIVQGRLLDTLGQARVLAVAAAVFGLSLALLVWTLVAGWPILATYVCAGLAGGTLPQIGSAVRARWSHVLDDTRDVQTAFAIEAVVDEAVFMLGPVVVTVLAAAIDPVAGLAVAVLACVGGTLALCAQRGTEPPARGPRRSTGPRVRMPWATVAPLAVVSAALGTLFGAAEVTTVAFASERGAPGWAGVLLALWALGSLLAGLLTGAITWRRGADLRVRWGAFAMFCAMVPLHFVGSVPVMGMVLLLDGFAIAPTLIATMSLIEAAVPAGRLNEGMAIVQTGLVAGVAPGAALAGVVVDAHGASAAYLVSAGAGLLAALAAQALPRAGSSA
ncbi:MFS transporter [Nocardioides panaciterrulae]|uniref:MFS family permease n=1 Tax=Nocardioides panaciterrulae TaxID=661492 RepID=A0A7Y9JBU6_9ACTN|nr:MFS transporter [Nocardioides panaciterrulae]NYD41604.1 MFS family permease [Nocardioides panaciterrulae]